MKDKIADRINRSVVEIERGSSVVLGSKVNTKSLQQFKRDASGLQSKWLRRAKVCVL